MSNRVKDDGILSGYELGLGVGTCNMVHDRANLPQATEQHQRDKSMHGFTIMGDA